MNQRNTNKIQTAWRLLVLSLAAMGFAGAAMVATAQTCGTGSSATGSGFASSGSGNFTEEVFWLDWNCPGHSTFAPGSTVTRSWDVGDGTIVSATITGATFSIQPYDTGSYFEDTLPSLYGGLNPLGLQGAVDGQDPQFDISFSATHNGDPIDVDLVVADAETTSPGESIVVNTSGGAFTLLEQSGGISVAGAGTQTATFSHGGSAGTALLESSGSPTLSTTLNQGGRQAVAFGVRFRRDFSDAPTAGYGGANHRQKGNWRLGATLTTETADYNDPNAAGDADDGVTFPTLTQGQSATLPVSVTQPSGNQGYLQAWIDWNGDGDFADAGEQVASDLQSASAGTSTISVPVTVPATATTSPTFVRFRWSSTQGLDSTTAASDGEVEDYAVTVQASPTPNFTTDDSLGNACVASGGVLGTTNFFTDLDGGTFGTGSGAADEIPTTNPYAAQISGGTYRNTLTGFQHGDYTIISNNQTPRNSYQYGNGIFDPVNGFTGRFFISDPNMSAPAFTSTLNGLVPGESYELSFWAADSETGTGAKQRIGIFVDGVEVYNTGFIANPPSGMVWRKYSFVYVHPTAASSANIQIRALETGSAGRDIFFDEIRLFECNSPADFGDAPSTGTSYGEPQHRIVTGLQLGAAVTDETVGYDDANAAGDADDGVTFPTLTQGQSATIPVSVTQASGNQGYLQAWIDWNGDGDFADAGEQVATDLQSATAGTSTISVPVTVPATATTSPTFARFRWSTTAGLDATAAAPDGEVEDYQVTVAPPPPPPSSGVINYPNSGNGLYRGSIGLLDWAGSGLDDGIRDGDSVSFALPECRAGTLTATFSNVTNPANATTYVPSDMNTWSGAPFHNAYNGPGNGEALHGAFGASASFRIDWTMTVNGVARSPDIFFFDAEASDSGPEAVSATTNGGVWALVENIGGAGYTATGIGTQSVTIEQSQSPSNTPLLLSMATTRTDIDINADGGLQAVGFGVLLPCDSGDAGGMPDAAHAFEQRPASGSGLEFTPGQLYLGSAPPDAETGSQANTGATGDDADALGDDEDGVTLPTLTQGTSSTLPVNVTQASANQGYLQAWIDWNGDGDFADTGEQVASDVTDGGLDDLDGSANGVIELDLATPAGATIGQTVSRFRWSSASGLGPDGAAADGEVEDYPVTIQANPLAGATPFTCDSRLWQLARKDTQLISISLSGTTATFTDTGSPAGGGRNAGWGYNETDQLAYGLSNTRMWAVDGAGTFYDLGTVGGLGSYSGSNAGDVLPDGTMLFKADGGGSVLGRIDLTRTPYSLESTVTLTGPASGANYIDFAFNPADGNVYSIDSSADRLFYFNPDTGATSYFGPSTHSGSFGAQWFDEDGNFFAYDNNTNEVYQFDVGTNGSGSGAATYLATSSADEGGRNDGFSCRGPSPLGSAELAASKTIELFDGGGTGDVYALPGEDVIYTINVSNTGSGPTDLDSVVLIDRMPPEVEFFTGDIDTGGPDTYPGSDPVGFLDNGSGLTFNYASDVGFSDQATQPAGFSACTYTPTGTYDPDVTYICFNPKGQMPAGDPDPEFSLALRARIR